MLPRLVMVQCDFQCTVSKRALQWYSKCYCVASVTRTFTLKGVHTIHRLTPVRDGMLLSIRATIDKVSTTNSAPGAELVH
jgi:hypothetical protein